MINLKKIDNFFENFKTKEIKDRNIEGEYYLLENNEKKLFIKTEFFIANIFSKGSKWGEELFKALYDISSEGNDILTNIKNFEGYSIDVNLDNELIENAILIPFKKNDTYTYNKEKSIERKTNKTKVVLRITKKKLTLDFIEKIGSGSQIILSDNMPIEVEIIDIYKNEVIGKGILEKVVNGYNLKIIEVCS